MEDFIKEYITKNHYVYIPIDESDLKIIYDLYHGNIVMEPLSVNVMY